MQETPSGFVNIYRYQLALREITLNSITYLRYDSEEYLDHDSCVRQACNEIDSMNKMLNSKEDRNNSLEYIFKIHMYYRQDKK